MGARLGDHGGLDRVSRSLRTIEEAGIPAVGIVNLKARLEQLKLPRAELVRFPRGATVGPPYDDATQRQVLADAFAYLEGAKGPGPLVELAHA